MDILIGIVAIVAGCAYAFFMYNKHSKAALEIQYMQTSTIKDGIEIVEEMLAGDPNYRHYVELKGTLESEEPIVAPFTERSVAYYENRTLSVNEETRTTHDKDGRTSTRVVKVENEIASEKSSTPTFITDGSCDTRVYVDFESFGGDKDLQEACDRFESENSSWIRRNRNYSSSWRPYSSSRFLGYRLVEKVLNNKQPLYILGELYQNGDKYYVGKSVVAKKSSKLTYKSEDQLVADTKKAKFISLGIGVVAAIFGIIIIIM